MSKDLQQRRRVHLMKGNKWNRNKFVMDFEKIGEQGVIQNIFVCNPVLKR